MTAGTVVVTGASTGIGWGIAKVLVAKGFTVFGSVRKQADAERLQAELGKAFTPLLMDVTDEAAVGQAAAQVRAALGGANLTGLVNNAGISLVGPLLHIPLSDVRRQMEVNLVAPLLVTQAFAGLLGADRSRGGAPGRIVNISSVGGKMGAPFLGAYAASKHALEGLSESLRRELMLYGIDVVIVEPGYVNTPILDKAEAEGFERYGATEFAPMLERFTTMFFTEGRKGMAPEEIGEVVATALTVASPKTCYTVMKGKLANWTIPMSLPRRTLDRLIGKRVGLLTTERGARVVPR